MMVKLFGANPVVAVLLGIGLLIFGIVTGRYILAAAGGFVVAGSAVRVLTSSRDQTAGGERGELRGDGWRGPAGRR
jgi:hypothetical protein